VVWWWEDLVEDCLFECKIDSFGEGGSMA